MSTVFETKPQGAQNIADISSKLEFQKQLQAVTNKIHATSNVDEIMLELGQDICNLLGADRLTVYVLSDDRNSIVSKVKTGLTSFKDLKLPINDQSMAGFVALNRNLINVRDVYDENELRVHSPQLRFLKEVDKRTGYRTKQMLVAPVVDTASNELVGVVQAINTRSGQPFSPLAEEGVVNLCETLAIALKQRQKPTAMVRGRYDALVANAVLSAEEMDLALRSARRKGIDIENVLLDEF
jgi:GAF domain-containing protein